MIIAISSIAVIFAFTLQNSNDSHADEILEKCSFIVDCAVLELEILSLKESEETILNTFDDLLITYSESLPFCHEYGHTLGHFLYDYLGDVNVSLAHVSPLACGGSVHHAIIMTHMSSQLSIFNNPSEIDITAICSNLNSQSRDRAVCLHGIGHGLTSIYNYDVLTAINSCKLFDEDWELTYCSKGVFMENIDNNARMGINSINEGDLFFPCNKIEDIFAPPCYFNHSPFIVDYNLKNVDYISKCDAAPKEFVKYCYSGIGAILAGSFFNGETVSCQLVHPEFQDYCYLGAVYTIAAEDTIQSAFPFCKTIPDQFKVDCYGEIGKMIKMVHSDDEKIMSECNKAEDSEYVDVCMNIGLDEKRIF